MGGDDAPEVVLHGADIVRRWYPELRFRAFGQENVIRAGLEKFPALQEAVTIIHTDETVDADDKPSAALRQRANSSMRLAINDVKDGHSVGVVSGGNTGAFMAMSKFVFRTLPGVERPAITGRMPTMSGTDCVMLDMGANVECSARNLYQFAVMGEAFFRAALKEQAPRIGILNIGSEELKGHESLREAAQMIRESHLADHFLGFVEGNDIGEGNVDVVVTDGFTGNVALKSAEGIGRLCRYHIKRAIVRNFLTKLGGLLLKKSLDDMRDALNPSTRNGGMLLGLNGIAVKSHGGADALGFANAIRVAHHMAVYRVNEKITTDLQSYAEAATSDATQNVEPATVS